jgi:hypothetical protein
VGGNSERTNYGGTAFSAELYSGAADDIGGAWIEVARHSIPAAYYSSAILLNLAGVPSIAEFVRVDGSASLMN